MRRLLLLICVCALTVDMGTHALAQLKVPSWKLKSISQTSTCDSSLFRLDFNYDLKGRLTAESVARVDSSRQESSYYNYNLNLNYEYFENKLTMMVNDREYSSFNLDNGNIQIKALEYKDGRLEVLSYSHPFWVYPLHDEIDKVTFHWEGDDVVAVSCYKGCRNIGSLRFEYREEKCNSPLMYAYTLYWVPNPYNLWPETWINHAALFHCGLLTPSRLIDSCWWSTGERHLFSYTFDSHGNPVSMSYDFPKNDYEYFTVTEKFTWE